jgi:hypothetical protein
MNQFGHSQTLAGKILDDYMTWMDESLKVDFKQFEKLLSQVAPGASVNARQVGSEWIIPRAVKA